MKTFPVEDYEQLANHIFAGETVFFIGAGFSLDSEQNSAERLLARLLVRFEALTKALYIIANDDKDKQKMLDLVTTMQEVFNLTWCDENSSQTNNTSNKWRQIYSKDNFLKLTKVYYPANDWFCEVFSDLLNYIYCQFNVSIDDIHEQLQKIETELFEQVNQEPNNQCVELDKVELRLYEKLIPRDRGKALFLDTMGFNNKQIMAGRPYDRLYKKAIDSYEERILPRHLILARWAREGFTPTILTSNYDLLLEGAYRQVGFNPVEPDVRNEFDLEKTSFDQFAVIAGPTEFFMRGHGSERALIVKIHGCVDRYRVYRDNNDKWQQYLKSIVFTYREIQNWREDSWSRDLVATLLRTRKMVFASYSVMDPVLHDTIRSIYEEIAVQTKQTPTRCEQRAKLDVPAYYLGLDEKKEFYGIEILRAAARVNGDDFPSLTDPTNYLRFNAQNDGFPSVDESFVWLFHRTYRLRQANLLETSLSRTSTMIFGKSRPKADIDKLKENFIHMCELEKGEAKKWAIGNNTRVDVIDGFKQVTSWTNSFHPKLLKEFALAECLQNNGGLASKQKAIRESFRYFSMLDYPNAAVWAVVIEVALKRALAISRNNINGAFLPTPWLTVGDDIYPQLHYCCGTKSPANICLTIKFDSNESIGLNDAPSGHFKSHVIWRLDTNSQPWTNKTSESGGCKVPAAEVLWRWAIEDSIEKEEVEEYLELNHGY